MLVAEDRMAHAAGQITLGDLEFLQRFKPFLDERDTQRLTEFMKQALSNLKTTPNTRMGEADT